MSNEDNTLLQRVARAICEEQDEDADATSKMLPKWRGWHQYAGTARAAIAAMAPEQIAGIAPFNAAIDAVAAAEGALCRARERADADDHAGIDAELANLRRARGAIHEARSEQEPQ